MCHSFSRFTLHRLTITRIAEETRQLCIESELDIAIHGLCYGRNNEKKRNIY